MSGIYVVDDLERLKELGIPLKDLKPSFFKYHKLFWDRFLIHQLSTLDAFGRGDKTDLVAVSMQRFVKNWERISKSSHSLRVQQIVKNLNIQFEIAIGLCNLYVEKNFDPLIREMITRQIELSSIETYDFNINQQLLNN